jgi:hypothetical protein
MPQNVFYFLFGYAVIINVRFSCFWIVIIADVPAISQACQYCSLYPFLRSIPRHASLWTSRTTNHAFHRGGVRLRDSSSRQQLSVYRKYKSSNTSSIPISASPNQALTEFVL